jgi:hypothetical protein
MSAFRFQKGTCRARLMLRSHSLLAKYGETRSRRPVPSRGIGDCSEPTVQKKEKHILTRGYLVFKNQPA